MATIPLLAALALGLAFGAALAYFLLRGQIQAREQAAAERERANQGHAQAKLEAELQADRNRLAELRQDNDQLKEERRATAALLDAEKIGNTAAQTEVKGMQQMLSLRDRELEAAQKRIEQHEANAAQLQEKLGSVNTELETLRIAARKDKESLTQRLDQLSQVEKNLKDTMAALAREALQGNNQSFLELAKEQLGAMQKEHKAELDQRKQAVETLVKPIGDSLSKFNETVQGIEKQRAEAYGGITQELRALREAQSALRSKADDLTNALRGQPTKWGRWGELQLRNVVEMAGMLPYCDFTEQESVAGDEGARLRPDMIVKLPNNKRIAVDSKAPVEMYIASMELEDEEARRAKLAEYAATVRKHLGDLTKKAYWDRIPGSPEFVVMFLPGESFFSAALEADPALIEAGVEQRVILATPTTLIALLRAVAYGWKQEQLAENARHISDAGAELVKRLRVFAEHLQRVGSGLNTAVGSYNDAVGSLERRVLPQARRMQELGAGDEKALPESSSIEVVPRSLEVQELFGRQESGGI